MSLLRWLVATIFALAAVPLAIGSLYFLSRRRLWFSSRYLRGEGGWIAGDRGFVRHCEGAKRRSNPD